MSSCILISSHLNSPYKVSTAIKNIKNIKNLSNLPIVFVGNYVIPKEIQTLVNFCFYQSHNSTINRFTFNQVSTPKNNGLFDDNSLFVVKYRDYGYAHLEQIYNGMKLVESLGFNHVIHFNYDIEVNDISFTKLKKLLSLNKNIFFKRLSQDGFETHSFCITTSKYINLWEKYHINYRNNNVDGIRNGFICEEFFKWMILKDDLINNSIVSDNLKFINNIDSRYGTTNYGSYFITPFKYVEKNVLVISSKEPIDELTFKFNGSLLSPEFLSKEVNYYLYLLPYFKGEYYINDDMIFNTLNLLNYIKTPKK